MNRRFGRGIAMALGLAPAPALAFVDTDPQTDMSAETLEKWEFRLGLGRFEAGVTENIMLGTMPLPWLLRIKNLQGKWRFMNKERHALSIAAGLYWFNARDFDEDNADIGVGCIPLRLAYTWRESPEFRYHFALSYTAITTRGEGESENDVEIEGLGVLETAVFNPTFEWVLTPKVALLVDASVALFQRVEGNADQSIVVDEYTTLDLHQDGDADLKSGFQGWLAAGALWSFEYFNVRGLLGYGHYPVPVVNFFVSDPIVMVDFDVYWRF